MSDVPRRLYRPSNGTEGDFFYADWCAKCERERTVRDPDADPADGCEIFSRTLIHSPDDADYPREWHWKGDTPVCSAFVAEGGEVLQPLDPDAVVRPLL